MSMFETRQALTPKISHLSAGAITMSSDISFLTGSSGPVRICDLANKQEAEELSGKIFGHHYWVDKWKCSNGVRSNSLANKAKRLIRKAYKSLPEKTDEFGNTVQELSICDSSQGQALATKLGCDAFNYFGADYHFVACGEGITFSYCEGDVRIYRGEKSMHQYHSIVKWQHENN